VRIAVFLGNCLKRRGLSASRGVTPDVIGSLTDLQDRQKDREQNAENCQKKCYQAEGSSTKKEDNVHLKCGMQTMKRATIDIGLCHGCDIEEGCCDYRDRRSTVYCHCKIWWHKQR
jgi:hypothetical protein